METDDLDPRDDPTPIGRVPFGAPHFARLVRSPAARRVSLRRLILAAGLGSTLAWGLYALGSRAAGALARYVADRPEHRIPFDAIELIPPPPPYIRSGSAAILDAVRQDGRFDSTLSVPGIDLDEIRSALKLNHWIEDVGTVQVSYRRVTAAVVYRKPLAWIVGTSQAGGSVIGDLVDRNGVVMPTKPDFDWAEEQPRRRPTRESMPLIQVEGFGAGLPGRVGYTWKPTTPDVGDTKVHQALRLAEFLAERAGSTTTGGRPYPTFVKILYQTDGDLAGFFLRDERLNWVLWGGGPGSEARDELKADQKWRMLGRYIDEHGMLEIGGGPQDHLKFLAKGAMVSRPVPKVNRSSRPGR